MKRRSRARQPERALERSLQLPGGERSRADGGRGEELAPVGEVAAARALRPRERVREHQRRERAAQRAVPHEQRVAAEAQAAGVRPYEAGREHDGHQSQRAGARGCEPRQHAAELDHEHERQARPGDRMRREHPRRTRRAGEPRRQAGRDTGGHQQRQAPVRTPRGHASARPARKMAHPYASDAPCARSR